MNLKLSLLLFLFFYALTSRAEIFVVTNNANEGLGTLREAIVKANGNGVGEIDYINFQLPGSTEDDRTILVTANFPSLSSKIVIDGTSQPGANIGTSHAKIIIKTALSYDPTILTVFSAQNVEQLEFYGIYFLDMLRNTSNSNGTDKVAIDINNGRNIVIGDTNRGNVFIGYKGPEGAIYIKDSDGLLIADNFVGVSPYTQNSVNTAAISLSNVDHIEIGGKDRGNIIFSIFILSYSNQSKIYSADISYNNIQVHQDGVTTEWAEPQEMFRITGVSVEPSDPHATVNVKFHENLMSHTHIKLQFLDGKAHVWHNWIGTDRTATLQLGNKNPHGSTGPILICQFRNGEVVFGHEDPKLGNIVAYSEGILAAVSPNQSVKIIRNSLKCITGKFYRYETNIIPVVEVTQKTESYIRGKSDPLAIVDVYLTDDCNGCSAETYVGTTTASANGEWLFNYPATYTRNILVNAHVGNKSSDFSNPVINTAAIEIVDADCASTGRISGVIISNTDKLKWIDGTGKTVSTELELKDAAPGSYKLVIGEFCTTESAYFTIKDLKPKLFGDFITKKNPTCGLADGAITNVFAFTEDNALVTYLWKDQSGKTVGNTANLSNLPSGSYTLTVSTSKCNESYGPFILQSPDSPTIIFNGIVKTPSDCGLRNGEISNVAVLYSGNVVFTWRNGKAEIVGNEKNLKNIPGGTYTLEVSDDKGCGTAISDPVIIPETNGISIDATGLILSPANCSGTNGSIIGLKVLGANAYKWLNESGVEVSASLNLLNAPAGKYRLVASNSVCSVVYEELNITTSQSTTNYASTKILTNAQCNQGNGQIEVIFTADQPSGYRWQNSSGETIGSSRILPNIYAGSYDLYITNDLGCERFYLKYSIGNTDGATINLATALVKNDQCDQGLGGITAPIIIGGKLPYFYEWKDSRGQVIGSGPVLDKIRSGKYYLTIGDAIACSAKTLSYEVGNETSNISKPLFADVKICAPGKVHLSVINAASGRYSLYNSNGTILETNSKGAFDVVVTGSQEYSILLQIGECKSIPSTVRVIVENEGLTKLPNTFSPNGDGFNDEWIIPGIGQYGNATVSIYNRYGSMVFQSKGYKSPFKGQNNNGSELPAGIYYYVISLNKDCGSQSGSLTMIR